MTSLFALESAPNHHQGTLCFLQHQRKLLNILNSWPCRGPIPRLAKVGHCGHFEHILWKDNGNRAWRPRRCNLERSTNDLGGVIGHIYVEYRLRHIGKPSGVVLLLKCLSAQFRGGYLPYQNDQRYGIMKSGVQSDHHIGSARPT